MAKADNIFLVGPMGVGKTTVGKRLARRLGKQFVDADREIEQRTGATINLIFDVEGEAGFRDRESRVLEELTTMSGIVLATGGGAVLAEANRRLLQARGVVIYLAAEAELLLKRTAHDTTRPLLMTDDREARIRSLLEFRRPLYQEVADFTIEVDRMTAGQIINRIMEYLEETCGKSQ